MTTTQTRLVVLTRIIYWRMVRDARLAAQNFAAGGGFVADNFARRVDYEAGLFRYESVAQNDD
jgi:hypothetical protein